jgi:hypothetical protein
MTVNQLIKELQKYPTDSQVKIITSSSSDTSKNDQPINLNEVTNEFGGTSGCFLNASSHN